MSSLFNMMDGTVHKAQGMEAAAINRSEVLQVARESAVWVATNGTPLSRTVTSDDVAYRMQYLGYHYSDLGNAAGSIFKEKQWRFTGERIQSRRPAAHAREIKVWRLENE